MVRLSVASSGTTQPCNRPRWRELEATGLCTHCRVVPWARLLLRLQRSGSDRRHCPSLPGSRGPLWHSKARCCRERDGHCAAFAASLITDFNGRFSGQPRKVLQEAQNAADCNRSTARCCRSPSLLGFSVWGFECGLKLSTERLY